VVSHGRSGLAFEGPGSTRAGHRPACHAISGAGVPRRPPPTGFAPAATIQTSGAVSLQPSFLCAALWLGQEASPAAACDRNALIAANKRGSLCRQAGFAQSIGQVGNDFRGLAFSEDLFHGGNGTLAVDLPQAP
jgi:hypothetical protein